MKSAEELNRRILKIINPAQLIELAKSNCCPHYVLINPSTSEEHIFFISEEINNWFEINFIKGRTTYLLPNIKFIEFKGEAPINKVPIELSMIRNLYEMPIQNGFGISGIYFLCKAGKLEYIGQSKSLMQRIGQHLLDDSKIIDSVFYIPWPINDLNNLEGTLIRKYKPPLNGPAPYVDTETMERIFDNIIKKTA